jgi:hypothetical protein
MIINGRAVFVLFPLNHVLEVKKGLLGTQNLYL